MKKYNELKEKELYAINGGGIEQVPGLWTPVKTAWDFGKWTGDMVFGKVLGWKKA
ncbi:hypothetical protein HRH62_14125 [Enterococcus faecalis]|uniref:hypothetical protein n=1 Tax=Enterococcus faecalis TaxID=1351 RepID=UPI001572B0C2|nr:hypothetical protein [Enterococcus faecalis]NSV82887.1 hypothetical protein [Enterococcus faecalis]NSW20820.1 hypothetical protein [Enterococcus faecalis]HDT8155478.1 hypothetical protein [Enterococcus faecalis]